MDELEFLKPSKRQRLKRRDKRLSEELIECRRGNGGDRNKKLREKGEKKRAKADLSSETPRLRSSYGDKRNATYQNDNLEPLIRFLQSHVGQAWDDVYAKLNQQLDKRSTLGLHVFEHLLDFVDINAQIIDGEIVFTNRYGAPSHETYYWWSKYYVHPVSKLMLAKEDKKQKGPYPKKARWKKEKEKLKLKIRLGIPISKPEPRYRYNYVHTHGKRLKVNAIYDVRISDLNHESRCRVKLLKIRTTKEGLKLHVRVLKSALKQKFGELVLTSKSIEQSYRYRSSANNYFFDWRIFDTGTYHFEVERYRLNAAKYKLHSLGYVCH